MELKTKIKQLAAEDIGIGLEKLRTYLSEESIDFNDCIIFESRFRRLKRERLRNIETGDLLDKKENKLLLDVIGFIDDLDIDASEGNQQTNRVVYYENIVVCCTAERTDYMKQFFSKHYFKNVSFYHEEKASLGQIDLIVFDDYLPTSDSESLLKSLLEDNNYVIYFGKRFPLPLAQYSDRAYFANSIFSLYARIKEMLDFLKYINPK